MSHHQAIHRTICKMYQVTVHIRDPKRLKIEIIGKIFTIVLSFICCIVSFVKKIITSGQHYCNNFTNTVLCKPFGIPNVHCYLLYLTYGSMDSLMMTL